MEKKNLIIISALLLMIFVLCVGISIVSAHIEYEKVNVVPNGTSMEMPTNNLTYLGDALEDGCEIWTFKQGGVFSFNNIEVENTKNKSSYQEGVDELNEIIHPVLNDYEKKEEIDGYTVYTMNGESVNMGEGKIIYVIMRQNEETGDNIIIMTDNKDITLHIAKSIEYKMGNMSINHTTKVSTTDDKEDMDFDEYLESVRPERYGAEHTVDAGDDYPFSLNYETHYDVDPSSISLK